MCCVNFTQGDLFSDVGASLGGLVQQAQQGAQQLGDALRAGNIVSGSSYHTCCCA
jgi:hypothetical protein